MSQRSVVVVAPVRTAIGTFGESLKDIPAPDLGAIAIKAAVARAGLDPEEVGTVVMGNVIQAGAKMNPARQAAIHAGLPVSVPAMTVNRVCGSGVQAIVSASHEIISGAVETAVAGGMENMDLAPYLIARGRWGYRMGDGQLYDSMLRDGLNDAFSDQHSGWHTEDLVREFQVSREAQDRWALRSQQRFAAAQVAGKFKDEIVAVEVPGRKGPTVFATDEHNRPETTLAALTALKPAFLPERHDHCRQCARPQQWGCCSDTGRSGFCGTPQPRFGSTARLVRHRGRRAGDVRAWTHPSGAPGARPRQVEALRHRSHGDQRGVCGDRDRRDARARSVGGYSQCRRRRDCAWPSDWSDGRRADDPPHPLDAPRRSQARHRDFVHRRRPRHRART